MTFRILLRSNIAQDFHKGERKPSTSVNNREINRMEVWVINHRRMVDFLGYLVDREEIHDGQRQSVLNQYSDRARHLLLDKREEMRRLMGKRRVAYALSEIELIASFRLRRLHQNSGMDHRGTAGSDCRRGAEFTLLWCWTHCSWIIAWLQIRSEAHSQSAIWLSHLNKTATA